ncbi:MAG: DUF1963 domain-containing protein [Steroidobacteraceae bacterium]
MTKDSSLLDRLRRAFGATTAPVAPTRNVDTPPDSSAQERRHAVLLVRGSHPIPEDEPAKSYLGGLPRLPSHFEWPSETPFEEPRSLTFVAQIDLSELPAFPERHLLPPTGTLYLFVSSDFDGVGEPPCKVLYFAGDATALPVFRAPDNLMLLGGRLYYYSRFWLDPEKDPRAKVEFKYPLSFVVTESYSEEERPRQLDAWQAALVATSNHDLRNLYDIISPGDGAWPFNWAAVEHVAQALRTKIERDPQRLKPLPQQAQATIAEVVAEARNWVARAQAENAFAAPFPGHAQEFRYWWLTRRTSLDEMIREHGLYHIDPERTFRSAIIYAVRLTCAAGIEARGLIPPHYLKSVHAETLWQRSEMVGDMSVNMPIHQMFGFGERVQNAPLDHANDVLLLQIKGDPGLAWHDNIGCALQLWIGREALQALRLQDAQATLECD